MSTVPKTQASPTMRRQSALVSAMIPGAVLVVGALLLVRGMTYRTTIDWASGLPDSVQMAFRNVSEWGLVVLIGLFGVAAVHALWRRATDRLAVVGLGVAAGVGVVLAYVTSEVVKILVSELRPCHNFADSTIAVCPSSGDWSWPSNHSTIAVGVAVGVLALSIRLGLLAVGGAAATGVSRVVVGVHYFHDIVAGALLGAVIVHVSVRWCAPFIARGFAAGSARLYAGRHGE